MQAQKLVRRRLFERLPYRYQKTHKVVVDKIGVIAKTNDDKREYVLGYHSPQDDTALNGILQNGFYTTRYGNKGAGAYFATHSTYPLTWGKGAFLLCKIFKNDHLGVFRSSLPPGFELTVTNNTDVAPICRIEARLCRKVGSVVDWRTDYWQRYNTGCVACDEQGVRCDCALPYDMLHNIISDDEAFMRSWRTVITAQ